MNYVGDITLPDGRIVHGNVCVTEIDRITGGSDLLSCDLEWQDGTPLTADECNEDMGGAYR